MIFTDVMMAIEEADFLATLNQMPYAICDDAQGFFVTPYAFTERRVLEVCRPCLNRC